MRFVYELVLDVHDRVVPFRYTFLPKQVRAHIPGGFVRRCDFADRFIVASGRSDRQIKALSQAVSEVAHQYGLPAKVEGLEAMEWLLVDMGDVVIHLFLPEVRESFQLERLWRVPNKDADAAS